MKPRISIADINLKKGGHWSMRTKYIQTYYDDKLDITMEVVTKRLNFFQLGKSESFYFIGEEKTSYPTAEALVEAYNKMADAPAPNNPIT